jgi:hypothetical protein
VGFEGASEHASSNAKGASGLHLEAVMEEVLFEIELEDP